MSGLNVSVDSDATKLILHFEKLPAAIKRQLEIKIGQLTHQLHAQVRAAEPVRTGRLRAATRAFVDVRQDFVRGRVRILPTGRAQRVAAAFGALEYGGPGHRRRGPVKVRAYTRDGVSVGRYERRRPHIAARRFLRGPAAAMRPRAMAELEAIVGKTIREFTVY